MRKVKFLSLLMLFFVLSACTTDAKYGAKSDDLGLYMISAGLLGHQSVSTQEGLYEILDIDNDFSRNIIYTDYETKSRFYLSSDLSLDPSSDDNTSYIGDVYGGTSIAAGNNKLCLFFFKTSSGIVVKKYGEKALPAIVTMDFNGENKRTVYTFAANEWMHDQSGIVCDSEDNLYFIESYLSDEGYSEKKSIVKVNIATGEKTDLVSLDNIDRDQIIGAYGDNLIIRKLKVPDREKPFYEQFDSREILIYTYNLATGDKKDVLNYGYDKKLVFCRDEIVYILDKSKQNLTSLNILTSDEKEIYKTDQNIKYDDISFWGNFYDNCLFLSRINGDEYEVFAVNADTGAVCFPLKDLNGEMCRIYGESEDYFYVSDGEIFYETELSGPKNTRYTVTARRPNMAFITKEDYWNGVANFIPLTDYVYPS